MKLIKNHKNTDAMALCGIACMGMLILSSITGCQSGKNFAEKTTFFGLYTNITDPSSTIINPKLVIGYGSSDVVYIEKGVRAEIARQYYNVDTLSIDGNMKTKVTVDATNTQEVKTKE